MNVTSLPVLVSGASGFIAAHIIAQLLEKGYRVRGTVRSLKKQDSYAHLVALPGAAERLELVEADLLTAGAFDAAAKGVEYVMHTASPFVLQAKDPQKDLVEPAVQGTRSMLESCARAGSVKRVVLTSSMAAITDEPESERVLSEADWNVKSSLTRNPYYLSKTLAEKEGWRFIEEEKPRFDLVVINPYFVVGPSLGPGLNPSNQLFSDLLGGQYPGIMSLTWGFVDVRDVAAAHILAMENPAAKGRYLTAGEDVSMRQIVELLTKLGYDKYKLPKLAMDCAIGDFTAKLASYFQPKGVGQYLRTHIGHTLRYDNSKVQRELGLRFRPLEQSVVESIDDLKKWGYVKAL
jgi:dihydroflavonol-4-reductase